MTNRWIFGFAVLFFTLTLAVSTKFAFAAGNEDVFLDEGDGDFDTMPIPPKADTTSNKPAQAVQQAASEPTPELTAPPDIMPDRIVETPEPTANEDLFNDTPAAKPAPKAAKVARQPKPQPVAKAKPSGKGHFAMTTAECPMLRKPASENDTIGQTKAPRKIWVEDVDANWVRVYNKNGEPAYLSRDCVK